MTCRHCEAAATGLLAAKQSRRGRLSRWIASLRSSSGSLAMTSGSSLRGTWRPSSLRGAKRRSNPVEGRALWIATLRSQ
ncbi:MAG: hypothetical protein LBT00_02550 [Spirochaetaceae bacterium]|nr:hypothetical protein [Spirochaetaceae bacterium]